MFNKNCEICQYAKGKSNGIILLNYITMSFVKRGIHFTYLLFFYMMENDITFSVLNLL